MSDEVDDFLAHYGVKGMKWGKRKKSSPRAAGYDDTRRRADKAGYGKRGVERINERMLAGDSYKKARTKERVRQNIRTAGIVAALSYAPVVANTAVRTLNTAVLAKQTSNGQRAAANIFASEKGLTNYETISLSYSSVKNIWE